MAYSDFIAAIDLGTSHLVGVVGIKNASGAFSIIAYDRVSSANSIRRGCVYNVEETASRVKRLILQLESKLNGAKIGKVYVGIGGQSLRSIDHSVVKELGDDAVVTEEVIDELYKESQSFRPDLLDVLAAVSPSYFLDGHIEYQPIGIPSNRIEARYKLIVGRPSLRRYATNSITEKAKIEIAGLVVSPLALADVVLSDDQKDLGCALIGFGAGVTTLTVYKGGKLVSLNVIPLGSHLITKDITSLRLVESEAERIKLAYGNANMDKDDDTTIQVTAADGNGLREIRLSDLNNVVEARAKEILENVCARLEESGVINNLGAGIIIAGGGSQLKNIIEVIQERLKMEVRMAKIRKDIIIGNEAIVNNPEYAVALGLLMQGTENCAATPPQKVEQKPLFNDFEVEVTPKQEPEPKVEKPKKKKSVGLFKNLTNKIDSFGKTLFDDEDTGK